METEPQQWDYKMLWWEVIPPFVTPDVLMQAGADGWELVSVSLIQQWTIAVCKRPRPRPAQA